MRLDKLVTVPNRANRATDPEIMAALAAEKIKHKDSLRKLGNSAKETTWAILLVFAAGSVRRNAEYDRRGRHKKTSWEVRSPRIHEPAVDATKQTVLLVSRILAALGRTAHRGIREGLKI